MTISTTSSSATTTRAISSRSATKRETDHAAAAYAIPYGGEEVKLHWANADQYYIKTGENFSHFAFDAVRHPEIAKLDEMARMAANVPASCKVRFEIVEADEGDHGNIKQGKDRFFILHAAKPCEMKDGTTVVSFEYREDPEQSGPSAKWQEKRRAEALDALKGRYPICCSLTSTAGTKEGDASAAGRLRSAISRATQRTTSSTRTSAASCDANSTSTSRTR